MPLTPPSWSCSPRLWWTALALSVLLAACETAIGLFLRALAQNLSFPVKMWAWMGGIVILLLVRTLLVALRDQKTDQAALQDGQNFLLRRWRSVSSPHVQWQIREGREALEHGTRASLLVAGAVMSLALLLPALVWCSPLLSLSLLVILPPLSRLSKLRAQRLRERSALENEAQYQFSQTESRAWQAQPALDAFQRGALVARLRRSNVRSWFRQRLTWSWQTHREQTHSEALVHAAAAVLGCLALVGWQQQWIAPADLLAFLGLSLMAYRPVREGGKALAARHRASSVWEQTQSLTARERPVPHAGGLRLQNWTAGHTPDTPRLWDALSFECPPGTTLLLHGPNGCGKSTFLAGLAQQLPVQKGTLDAGPIRAWMPQEPVLPPLSMAQWSGCPEIPTQGVTGELFRILFPQGLPTGVHWEQPIENGHQLSRGERARIFLCCIALRPAHLWLLDEPLSALPNRDRLPILRALLSCRQQAVVIVSDPDTLDLARGKLCSVPSVRGLELHELVEHTVTAEDS